MRKFSRAHERNARQNNSQRSQIHIVAERPLSPQQRNARRLAATLRIFRDGLPDPNMKKKRPPEMPEPIDLDRAGYLNVGLVNEKVDGISDTKELCDLPGLSDIFDFD